MSGASPPEIVGRAAERAAIGGAVAALREGQSGTVVVVEGEPGIGKSRLLAHLAAIADGCAVHGARASEFEADLPYALWTEALDRDVLDAGEDRHRTHRALRDLLEDTAATSPLVLCLDDVHWADPASLDALAALVRRPPTGPVLIAMAAREGQVPAVVAAALGAAARDDRLTALALAPLSQAEAVELVGAPGREIYSLAGGNPFYLEQLARAIGRARNAETIAADDFVPAPVAAALAAELGGLSAQARVVIDAAAVAGDPFDPALTAEIASLGHDAALAALDELLAGALVRPTGTPGRFAFRHPVVRHAIYAGTPAGWRLGAHARAAAALQRRGAGAVERAHHVEQSAGLGDGEAIGLLRAAAEELQSPAPANAARFYAAALRLLPAESTPLRTQLQARLADAQAAAGDALAARRTLLDALQAAPDGERLAITVALANQEWWLGGHEDARRRLHVALAGLPAQPSPDRIRLRLALALTAMMACELAEARAQASDARDDARSIGDPVFEVATLAAIALATASAADAAVDDVAACEAALDRLTPAQLATRLPAFWMLGRAHRALGSFEAARATLERGIALATETGRERVLLVLEIESVAALIELGRLREAAAAADEGVELARLAGNPRTLLWALSARSCASLAAGDVSAALAHAEEASEIDEPADFYAAGQPGWCFGAALVAAGNPERAVPVLAEAFGGPSMPRVLPADRPAAAADLADALLACGDVAAAEEAIAAETLPDPATAGIARAAVLLARGRADEAVTAAAEARDAAAGAPLTAARARLAEGRALAASGRRRAAIGALVVAEEAFDTFGALRLRDEAVRELRRLGHRVVRPAREAEAGPLTAREREIAALVAAGRTNREIASQLVLSTRTIEAHLRNIFAKLGVRSRVELARADYSAASTSLAARSPDRTAPSM